MPCQDQERDLILGAGAGTDADADLEEGPLKVGQDVQYGGEESRDVRWPR